MFELEGATKQYGTRLALAPTTLRIAEGRTTVLLGTSGCGKTTLLRMLVGLVRADTGVVRFRGEDVAKLEPAALRRRVGYLVQGGGLFPHLDARGNATLMARHLKWDAARITARLDALLELTRLPREVLDRYPVQLSGGQRQRVALMRALFLEPEVLLLDEPFGALDPITRFELQEDLKAIFARLKKTVVLVTHDLGEAAHFGDEVVLLREGRIVQSGSMDALVEQPADDFVRRFVQAQRAPLERLT